PIRDHAARRLAHVVGVRLEREPEQRDRLPPQRAEMLLQLLDDALLLELVHLPHRLQEHERVTGVARELLERAHVFWKTRAAEANTGAQEVRAEPMVETDTTCDVRDVGADELADVRDLVDEADARREKRVRCEL